MLQTNVRQYIVFSIIGVDSVSCDIIIYRHLLVK